MQVGVRVWHRLQAQGCQVKSAVGVAKMLHVADQLECNGRDVLTDGIIPPQEVHECHHAGQLVVRNLKTAIVANNAKEKGGVSMLTYHHFVVKLPYYKKAAEGKLDLEKAKEEYKELLEELYKSTKKDMDIEQVAFQKLLGKMEVIGELLIKHK